MHRGCAANSCPFLIPLIYTNRARTIERTSFLREGSAAAEKLSTNRVDERPNFSQPSIAAEGRVGALARAISLAI